MLNKPTWLPYGRWPSPIEPALLARRKRFEDVQFTADGSGILWLETRGAQGVLVGQWPGEPARDLTFTQSVRGTIGYGGGEFHSSREAVVYACSDKGLYRRDFGWPAGRPILSDGFASASPAFSADGRWLVCVRSDGESDWLALLAADGSSVNPKLVYGADFYMQPVWHPSGERIAWVEWDHPNMPWNESRVVLAELEGEIPQVGRRQVIAGSPGEAYSEPRFSPDGRMLSYIASQGDWEALIILDLAAGERRVLVGGEHMLLRTPAWIQGMRHYGWSSNGSTIYYLSNYNSRSSLWEKPVNGGESVQIDTRPYTWLKQLSVSPIGGGLALIGSSAQHPERVLRWDGHSWQALAYNDPWMFPPEVFAQAQPVSWRSLDGAQVNGIYYPPHLPGVAGEGAPPLIVNVHGGPTSQALMDFPREAHFFTTRGFAWLDVNYRGSAGLGRAYLQALAGRWGELDTLDAVSGAQAMVEQGRADSARLFIHGGSAGGFTVLNALIRHPGVFRAGIALYPVTDLFTIDEGTHKFESHYTEWLVGKLPHAQARYREFSPLYNCQNIRDALIIFQGEDDTAVPPSQAQGMVERLSEYGIDIELVLYPGEGHGFRQPDTIEDCFARIESFLAERL